MQLFLRRDRMAALLAGAKGKLWSHFHGRRVVAVMGVQGGQRQRGMSEKRASYVGAEMTTAGDELHTELDDSELRAPPEGADAVYPQPKRQSGSSKHAMPGAVPTSSPVQERRTIGNLRPIKRGSLLGPVGASPLEVTEGPLSHRFSISSHPRPDPLSTSRLTVGASPLVEVTEGPLTHRFSISNRTLPARNPLSSSPLTSAALDVNPGPVPLPPASLPPLRAPGPPLVARSASPLAPRRPGWLTPIQPRGQPADVEAAAGHGVTEAPPKDS
jgi:hypothetical protein